jgi:gliding motility-associated-like protein
MKHYRPVRNKHVLLCLYSLLLCSLAHAQIPPQQWAQHYGGSKVDIPFSIKFTSDGGTIVAGYTDSKNGDVKLQPTREYWDLWVLKLDKCGSVQWEKSLGGTGYESARDIEQTADGGYIVLGETNSTDGDVPSGYGGTKDIWLLKFTAAGTVQWQKRIGGTGLDIGNHITIASDGGYLIAASSSSNDGDIHANHGIGYTDGVLIKTDANGTVLWSKCFGGTKNEELLDIEIINGKIFAAGYANSTDGDIPPNQKNYDVWLLALDANGNKIFSKIYGGSQNDVAYSMTKGADGSLTLAGYTTSTDGDVSGAKGSQDYWIINVSQSGKLNWQKVLGGSDADYANTIITDKDSSYIIGGISYSSDKDVTGAKGDGDYWVVKLSAAGNIVWKKNWGGSKNDNLRSIIYQPLRDEYYLCGDSESGNGDFRASKGETDFGIIKLKQPELLSKDSTVCSINGFVAASDTLRDVCGYDSLIVSYKPVTIKGPFDQLQQTDSIFVGQTITLPSNGNGTVIWNMDPTLSCSNCANPIASPQVTTIYTATNSIAADCMVSDQFTVVVLKDAVVQTPTGFTPNGDGLNDYFGPIGKVPEHYLMQIFDRNGETVFKSSSLDSKWDGRYKGRVQPSGVFIYLINYKDMQNKPHQQKGTLALIR